MIRKLTVMLLGGAILLLLGVTSALAIEYNEADMLRVKVAAGELPPVEERLPEEPLVVTPLQEIGQYGGTIHCFTAWANTADEGGSFGGMIQMLLHYTPDGKTIVPNIIKKWEFSNDGKMLTLYLRKGMKWSDGHLVTAEDMIFWWEDIMSNQELTPVIPTIWCPGGKPMKVEKIGDYTIRLRFSTPYPAATISLTSWEIIWAEGFPFQPKHYLKDFHIKYNPKVNELAKENDFATWFQYFGNRASTSWGGALNLDLPTIGPYKLVEKKSDSLLYERNPYFWKVDTEGNQLPYIDRVLVRKVANAEMVTAKILSGEADFSMQYTALQNYPLYKENADQGGYRVLLWPSALGGELNYHFNQTYNEDPVLREMFRDVRFRRALSLAINREEVNEVLFFGLGTPRQWTILPNSVLYEPRFGEAYAQYDPDEANRLLDEMGLEWDENHKYRLGANGERVAWILEIATHLPGNVEMAELVKEYWEDVGVEITINPILGELMAQRAIANKIAMNTALGGRATDIYFLSGNIRQFAPTSVGQEMFFSVEWARWYITDGKEGEEPPEEVKKLYEWRDRMMATTDEEEKIQMGKKILSSQAENIWQIGVVGLVPKPVIVNDNLRNVPEEHLYGSDYAFVRDSCPEQYYFKQE